MFSNLSPFRIEILDANNNPISGGSIGNAFYLNDTKRLDAIGSLEFAMPASDEKALFIETGVKFDVYDEQDGYLGRYLFKSKQIDDENGQGVLKVVCYDYLKELAQRSVYFNRSYNLNTVSSIISDLMAIVGWSANVTEVGHSQVTYQGESILRAIDELRDRRGVHYRLNYDKTSKVPVLDFGSFGELSEVYFDQANGQIQSNFLQSNNALIVAASIVEESEEIYNRIIPLGSGQGISQLTIERANLGNYTTKTGVNKDGSNFYYIEDTQSIDNYGLRERILSFPNISPLTNSDINVINAANTLKLTAESYLKKHLIPRKEYQIDIIGLRKEILPGMKVHIRYVQERNGVNYLSIDDDFWVMEITRNRSVNGLRDYNLKIANVDQLRTTDQDVIVDVVRDLNNINVHIPATLTYAPIGPYVKRIKGAVAPVDRVNATFTARIKEEVLYLNRALLRMTLNRLKSSTTGASAGGGSTETSSGGGSSTQTSTSVGLSTGLMIPLGGDHRHDIVPHSHDVSLPSHTHNVTIPSHTHGITYGVFEDTVVPENIGIIINNNDVTNQLFGPFNPSGLHPYSIELDITDILTNTIGGFRQTHEIQFYSDVDCHGEIEFELDLLCTIQPIKVT
jgi:hypothetical protein